jgi:hypothetical protein
LSALNTVDFGLTLFSGIENEIKDTDNISCHGMANYKHQID